MAMTAPTGTVRFARWLDTRLLYIKVRDAAEYFDHIQDVKITKDTRPRQAHRRNQSWALPTCQIPRSLGVSLARIAGEETKGPAGCGIQKGPPKQWYNLMDALRSSIKGGERTPGKGCQEA